MATTVNVFGFMRVAGQCMKDIKESNVLVSDLRKFISDLIECSEEYTEERDRSLVQGMLSVIIPQVEEIIKDQAPTHLLPVKAEAEEAVGYPTSWILSFEPPVISDDDSDNDTIEEDFDDQADIDTVIPSPVKG
jgi:hypothetical protein